MHEITLLVQGSEPEPYRITARRIGHRFRMSCSCKAGRFHTWCKHRAALIAGDLSIATDPPADAAQTLASLLDGSDAEAVAQRLLTALAEADAAKKKADLLKKEFAALLDAVID